MKSLQEYINEHYSNDEQFIFGKDYDENNYYKKTEFNDVKNQIIQKLIQENQEKKYLDLMKELEAKYDVKRF